MSEDISQRNPIGAALAEIQASEGEASFEGAQVHATRALVWATLGLWTQQQVVLDQAAAMACPHPPDKREAMPIIENGRARNRIVCAQCGQEVPTR